MKEYYAGLRDEWIDFVSKLIAGKALSGAEKNNADLFLEAMTEMGVECFRDACGNVTGIIRGNEDGPNVLLTGHMDVVPAGNADSWGELNPFQAQIEGDLLYGRGISDMLGGLSAAFFAFREIKKAVDRGEKLKGNLIFSAVVQEEPAESLGTLYLMEHTFPEHNIKVDVAFLESRPTETWQSDKGEKWK